jgi:hypothetical protein
MVRSTVAGLKFGIALRDGAATSTKTLPKLCTIPTANTWTLISLPNLPSFVAAGGGTFNQTPGNVGYLLDITLAAGSTITAAANDTWQNGNFIGALGQSNFAASPVNSTFDIGFIQHEPGPLCTTPIDCPFTQNLDECLRYYCKSYDYGIVPGAVSPNGQCTFTAPSGYSSVWGTLRFPKLMAKGPVTTIYNPVTGAINSARDQGNNNYATTGGGDVGVSGFANIQVSPSLGTAAMPLNFHFTADVGW